MPPPPPVDRGLWAVALPAFFAVVVGAMLVEHAVKGDLASLSALFTIPSTLGLYVVFFAMPSGLPALLLGVHLAARLLARGRRESLVIWSLRGVAVGATLGVLGVGAWFGLLNIATPSDFLQEFPELAMGGAGCGATVGLAVGVRCWHASRLAAPPPLPC